MTWHMFSVFYGWPYGLVWGNIAAEPLIAIPTLILAWVFRHKLMARWTAFRHHHEQLHLKRFEALRAPVKP